MTTRYAGVLAKDLQGEDKDATLALMGRARTLVGRALDSLKFAGKQQVHMTERQADGSVIHAMVTDFIGNGIPQHKVWVEVPPRDIVSAPLRIDTVLTVSSALFFVLDQFVIEANPNIKFKLTSQGQAGGWKMYDKHAWLIDADYYGSTCTAGSTKYVASIREAEGKDGGKEFVLCGYAGVPVRDITKEVVQEGVGDYYPASMLTPLYVDGTLALMYASPTDGGFVYGGSEWERSSISGDIVASSSPAGGKGISATGKYALISEGGSTTPGTAIHMSTSGASVSASIEEFPTGKAGSTPPWDPDTPQGGITTDGPNAVGSRTVVSPPDPGPGAECVGLVTTWTATSQSVDNTSNISSGGDSASSSADYIGANYVCKDKDEVEHTNVSGSSSRSVSWSGNTMTASTVDTLTSLEYGGCTFLGQVWSTYTMTEVRSATGGTFSTTDTSSGDWRTTFRDRDLMANEQSSSGTRTTVTEGYTHSEDFYTSWGMPISSGPSYTRTIDVGGNLYFGASESTSSGSSSSFLVQSDIFDMEAIFLAEYTATDSDAATARVFIYEIEVDTALTAVIEADAADEDGGYLRLCGTILSPITVDMCCIFAVYILDRSDVDEVRTDTEIWGLRSDSVTELTSMFDGHSGLIDEMFLSLSKEPTWQGCSGGGFRKPMIALRSLESEGGAIVVSNTSRILGEAAQQ